MPAVPALDVVRCDGDDGSGDGGSDGDGGGWAAELSTCPLMKVTPTEAR
eukprot:CAMPEP_0205936544 /NCGR_PEP_ID=MMETSP1325-20131115/41873_1 /ASSEMBLY_ACC=CAM_ASM_000708 /TAXON_ID=236786 /ORGANISM="Florenciella sp., Strain RCC1007" /LENGTH=48 /DNA_ID= /DNA_START= /DNA_END= /DNA_ORIENTATION=